MTREETIVKFSNMQNSYYLLEWPEKQIPNFLAIRGLESDAAVICTDSSTYPIKELQTSNSILITKQNFNGESESFQEIVGQVSSIWEAVRGAPNLGRVRSVLARYGLYQGQDIDSANMETGCSLNTLLSEVQASEQEVKRELKRLDALVLGDNWNLIDDSYMQEVLELVITCVRAEGWPTDAIPLEQAVKVVLDEQLEANSYPLTETIIRHCIESYCAAIDKNDTKLFKLDQEKLGVLLAKVLLQKSGKMLLESFLQSWQNSMQEVLGDDAKTIQLSWLKGIAIVEGEKTLADSYNPTPQTIHLFLREDLPSGVEERFRSLFLTKSKWKYDDILPYLSDLAADTKSLSAMILKNTRSSMINGEKHLNSRFPLSS